MLQSKITTTDAATWRLTGSYGLRGKRPDKTYSSGRSEVLASREIDTFVTPTIILSEKTAKIGVVVYYRDFTFLNTHVFRSKRNKLEADWTRERKKYDENFDDDSADKDWGGKIGGKWNEWL